MARLLIGMRRAMAAHRHETRFGRVSQIATAVLGVLLALSTLGVGIVRYPTPLAGADVVALSMAVWVCGRLALAAFGVGDDALRLETFRLLPIGRARLGRALLVAGFADPSLVVVGIAFGAIVALGAAGGALAVVVGIVGALLTLLDVALAVTVVVGMLPSRAQRRRDLGTTIVAVAISLVAVAGSLIPTLTTALTAERLPVASAVLRILPSGWAAVAVSGARTGDAALTLLPLLGLVLVGAGLVVVWPVLLGRRLDGSAEKSRRARRRGSFRALLPGTRVGGVAQKELRMWFRDPTRLTFLLLAALVGIGTCVVPFVAHGTPALLPFAGVLTALIAGASASNLYGLDALALRLVVLTPGGAAADVRGRRLAWTLIVGPYALLLTVVLTAVSGQTWAWPWALAIIAAAIGWAAGVVPLSSAIAVLPLAPGGGLTAGWPIKIYAAMLSIVLICVPAVAVLVVGAATGSALVSWLAVPVGAACGLAAAIGFGRLAAVRLDRTQWAILERLTAATSPA